MSSKLSPILLVHEMQGSLVGAVWDVGVTDPVEKLRHEAIQWVSHDDLSASDNLLIITLFA